MGKYYSSRNKLWLSVILLDSLLLLMACSLSCFCCRQTRSLFNFTMDDAQNSVLSRWLVDCSDAIWVWRHQWIKIFLYFLSLFLLWMFYCYFCLSWIFYCLIVLYATTLLITKNLIKFGNIKVERMNEALHFCPGALVFHLKPLLWV